MTVFLIDDQGEIWRADSRKLRAAFDTPFSGGEFVDYSIRNLGFAGVNIFGTSCQVRFRPSFITGKALGSLVDWLNRTRAERVVLTTFEREWRDELLKTKAAIGRLETIVAQAQPSKPADYLTKSLTLSALQGSKDMRDIVTNWRFLVERYDSDTLIKLARYTVNDRFAVIKTSAGQGKLVFHEIGEEIYSRYDTWRTCAVGAPIEEQPDRQFGRWMADSYYECVDSDVPRLDEVDAIIRLPSDGRTRRRYRRLVFPVPTTGHGTLLIGGSIMDQSIDLRVAAN